MAKLGRPAYKDYPANYDGYIKLVEEDDLIKLLKEGLKGFPEFIKANINADWDYRYEEGKWSARELLHHMLDTERIMSYRALCISRDDKSHMPGFDQTGYVTKANANKRSIVSMISEYKAIRNAAISLFKQMSKKESDRIGYSNGMHVTARSIGYVIIGHQRHHMNILKQFYNFK